MDSNIDKARLKDSDIVYEAAYRLDQKGLYRYTCLAIRTTAAGYRNAGSFSPSHDLVTEYTKLFTPPGDLGYKYSYSWWELPSPATEEEIFTNRYMALLFFAAYLESEGR